MKLATSYFGNRIPRHVGRDMRQLKALGFDRVIHTFSENDLLYYRGTFSEIVRITADCGLEPWLDPWGVARVFGGEAFSQWIVEDDDLRQRGPSGRTLVGACINHPRLRERLREWVDAAAETGARGVFWDEPHWSHRGPGNPDGEICVCPHCRRLGGTLASMTPEEVEGFRGESIARLLREMIAHAKGHGLESSVCVFPTGVAEQPALAWPEIARMPGVTEFGTDPYWLAFGIEAAGPRDQFIDAQCAAANEACRAAGIRCMLWLQAFRIAAAQEENLIEGARRVIAHRPDVIALWGFEACAHMSGIACERPATVWRRLIELVRPERAGAIASGGDGGSAA
jgi:hypothetical protein